MDLWIDCLRTYLPVQTSNVVIHDMRTFASIVGEGGGGNGGVP